MLIGFRVKNWRSIKHEISFSMLASQERQHGARLKKLPKYRTRLLPVALMFGGNAAGKSNFINALAFMQKFILNSPQAHQGIPGYEPYRFDESTKYGPSEFEVEILLGKNIYRYSFTLDAKQILHESLVKVLAKREQVLFERKMNSKIALDVSFQGETRQRLEFVFLGTQDNELFLSNTVDQKIELFKPVYDWFANDLYILDPSSQLIALRSEVLKECNKYLPLLDTGVKRLEFQEVSRGYLREDELDKFSSTLAANGAGVAIISSGEKFIIRKKEDNSVDLQLLFSFHETSQGTEDKLNFADESDGTKRLFDLLPAFVGYNDQKTIFIDEIDRSLHSMISKQLFSFFLEKSKICFKQQIIATTHDLQLMTQELFRRDEMWIFERKEGATELFPLSDFEDIRYDKDIRKSYLEGRMGGIPQIMLPLPESEDCK